MEQPVILEETQLVGIVADHVEPIETPQITFCQHEPKWWVCRVCQHKFCVDCFLFHDESLCTGK